MQWFPPPPDRRTTSSNLRSPSRFLHTPPSRPLFPPSFDKLNWGFHICLLRACCYGTGQPLNFGLLLHGSSSCSTRPRPVLTQDWENVDNKVIRQHWLSPGEKINILRSFRLQFLSDPRLNVVRRTTESPNDLQRLHESKRLLGFRNEQRHARVRGPPVTYRKANGQTNCLEPG